VSVEATDEECYAKVYPQGGTFELRDNEEQMSPNYVFGGLKKKIWTSSRTCVEVVLHKSNHQVLCMACI
jgi:hypothetical protein